jgi:hypothetical protein
MAWETRRGHRYYYRSVRRGGRVVKEYFGTGRVAELCAQLDAVTLERRAIERQDRGAERDRFDAMEGQTLELIQLTDALVAATLTIAGYHRHDRGAWRRRRDRSGPAEEEAD